MTMTSQTTKLIAAAPAALAAAAAVLLVLIIPPTWAGFGSYEHVHIANELEGGKVLLAHCHSSEHDLGEQYVNQGNEFEWKFHNRVFRKTHWVCYLAPDNNRHLEYDAFNETFIDIRYDFNVFWTAREDGLYLRDPITDKDFLSQPWAAGRLPVAGRTG